MTLRNCSTCIHWKNSATNPATFTHQGECWWGPPSIVLLPKGLAGLRLSTISTFACHRFEDRTETLDPLKEVLAITPRNKT